MIIISLLGNILVFFNNPLNVRGHGFYWENIVIVQFKSYFKSRSDLLNQKLFRIRSI